MNECKLQKNCAGMELAFCLFFFGHAWIRLPTYKLGQALFLFGDAQKKKDVVFLSVFFSQVMG
jgi:hypothetical protein